MEVSFEVHKIIKCTIYSTVVFLFFNYCLTVISHSPDVNHCVLHIPPGGHPGARNKIGFLSPTEGIMGFESGIFRF